MKPRSIKTKRNRESTYTVLVYPEIGQKVRTQTLPILPHRGGVGKGE